MLHVEAGSASSVVRSVSRDNGTIRLTADTAHGRGHGAARVLARVAGADRRAARGHVDDARRSPQLHTAAWSPRRGDRLQARQPRLPRPLARGSRRRRTVAVGPQTRGVGGVAEFRRMSAKVIVVLPAFNAARTLRSTWESIPKDLVDEVLLVDDDSSDNTLQEAARLPIRTIASAPQRRLRREPENVLPRSAALGRRRGGDAASRRPIRPGAASRSDRAHRGRRRRTRARQPHDDARRGPRRRHAVVPVRRQQDAHRDREHGDAHPLRRAAHRLPRRIRGGFSRRCPSCATPTPSCSTRR